MALRDEIDRYYEQVKILIENADNLGIDLSADEIRGFFTNALKMKLIVMAAIATREAIRSERCEVVSTDLINELPNYCESNEPGIASREFLSTEFINDMSRLIVESEPQVSNGELPYDPNMPGKTLDEYMASWDELIEEVRLSG